MTFWAKLLTIVILVLSIAFAAMSAVVFAKREDYRDRLNKMTYLKESNEAEAKTTQAKLKTQWEDADRASRQAAADLNALQIQFDTLHAKLAQQTLDLDAANRKFDKEQDESLRLAKLTETLGAQVKDMAAANDKLKGERDDNFAKMSAERNRANQLEKDNTELRDKLDTTTASLKDAQDTIKLNEEVFATLSRHNIEAQRFIGPLTKLPEIKDSYGNSPKVSYVDTANNSVVLNVGRKQGVKKNFEFTIFRGGDFIAKVNVFNTEDEYSAAYVVTTNLKHLPIQRGDTAATRLVGQ